MKLPKSTKERIDHAESLVQRFENYEPRTEDERDGTPYRALEAAVRERADAEHAIADAVAEMREARWTWLDIGSILGTTGQAAQQRYGKVGRSPSAKAV